MELLTFRFSLENIFNSNNVLGKISRSILCFLTVLLFLALACLTVQAEYAVPQPSTELYVLDQAGVISDETEAMIINTSKELARQTKAQVAVVTLTSIEDQPIEDVGLAILRDWGLGDKELNNGLLLLVVPSDRQMRIEVGYGLEGALPDAKTGRIRDQYIIPAFKQDDYDLGIRQGYIALVQEAAKEYNVSLNVQQDNSVQTKATPAKELPTWAVILIIIGVVILFWLDYRFLGGFIFGVLLSILARGGRGGGGFGGGGFGGGSSGGGGSGGGGGSSGRW
ncbi:MAG: TPM domain-containing protein [Syntrophomonadaceae bacterium]|nr:TPM domain-containing protein [Syntrophomonadaceae bacterium]MDD3023692.1 TPM domain-containing protein [Syntrophomonadaceae bacterium]